MPGNTDKCIGDIKGNIGTHYKTIGAKKGTVGNQYTMLTEKKQPKRKGECGDANHQKLKNKPASKLCKY